MNSIFLDKTLIYNPCLRFRNNKDKCVAYVIDNFFQNPYNFTILSSSEVIFLLLFDGILSTVQVIKNYAYIFKLPYNNTDDLLLIFNKLYESLQQRLRVEKLLLSISEVSEKTLISLGVRVRIKSVVTPYSIKNIKETLNYFANLGVEGLHLAQYGRSFYRHQNSLFLSNYQLNAVRAVVKEFRKKTQCKNNFIFDDFMMQYRTPVNIKNISDQNIFLKRGICNAGRFMITLLPNGEVSICENLPYKKDFILGDLREQSVMEYWNSDRVKQWLSPPPRDTFADGVPCKICPEKYYVRCHKIYSRCLRFSYETFGIAHTSDINCPYTKFKKYRVK